MVRMKDVMKSFEDVNKGPTEPRRSETTTTSTPSSSGKLSGLDAIRNAIQSGLNQQRDQISQPPPPAFRSSFHTG